MTCLRLISFFILTFLVATLPVAAQIELKSENYRVFDKDGREATLAQIAEAAGNANCVFLGENHDDAVGHAVQAEIFKQVVEKYATSRPVALSLEMFERDTQIVVDEYLADLITEKQFLANARPWKNYETDYKPLLERAKAGKLPVIAANAPRRYVNMVSRNGRGALEALSPRAKSWLAPLPYGKASAAYTEKFNALMGHEGMGGGNANLLESQSLWDATMAFSISEFLQAKPEGLVVHLNGKFHTEKRLGTVEHFLTYRPAAKALVVTIQYDESFPNFELKSQAGLGDFVILTDPKVKRSQ